MWQYLLVDNSNLADIPEYKKILKEVVEDFIGLVEMADYEEFENINKLKKEITEHFDKFFKDPEFDRLISKATDWSSNSVAYPSMFLTVKSPVILGVKCQFYWQNGTNLISTRYLI